MQAYRRMVDMHGQLLLLVHWGSLARTGLAKILKKHQKRTGRPVDSAELDELRPQFCSMEVGGGAGQGRGGGGEMGAQGVGVGGEAWPQSCVILAQAGGGAWELGGADGEQDLRGGG